MTYKKRRLLAVSAVLGMVIGIGLTAAVGGGVYYAYQQQADLFATSSQLEVRNLNAVRSGDTLTITANVKNVGSTSLGGIELQEISVGEKFEIVRIDEEKVGGQLDSVHIPTAGIPIPIGSNGDGDAVTNNDSGVKRVGVTIASTANTGGPKIELKGFKQIDGGSSAALRIKITYNLPGDVPGDLRNLIQISERLTFQLFYESGQDEFVSDVYNTRVRPG